LHERLAFVGLYSPFYLSICLKNLKDFPFYMAHKAVFMAKVQIIPQPLFAKKMGQSRHSPLNQQLVIEQQNL